MTIKERDRIFAERILAAGNSTGEAFAEEHFRWKAISTKEIPASEIFTERKFRLTDFSPEETFAEPYVMISKVTVGYILTFLKHNEASSKVFN